MFMRGELLLTRYFLNEAVIREKRIVIELSFFLWRHTRLWQTIYFRTMAIRLLLVSFVFFQAHFSNAQMHWEWVPGAPTFTPIDTDRTTDITFVDDTVGYLITRSTKIYRTQNGGDNWDSLSTLRYAPYTGYNSQIEFINRDTGFAMVPYDTILYQTTDGGSSWHAYNSPVLGSTLTRFTSISRFEQTVFCLIEKYVYDIILTIDVTAAPMPLDTLWGFSFLRGYVSASANSKVIFGDSSTRGKIVFSDDAGSTWPDAFTSAHTYRVYDLQMLNTTIGYALAGKSTGTKYFFIKTTDGGKTWNSIPGTDTITANLGAKMFFANETTGWTGYPTAGLLETTDGGATWHFIYEGQYIYCFAQTPSGVVYAGGKNVIRIDSRLINSLEQMYPQKKGNKQFSVFPNPASNYFKVSQGSSYSTQPIFVKLFDVLGNKLLEQKTYLNERISVTDLASGVYKIQISTDGASEFHTLIFTHNN